MAGPQQQGTDHKHGKMDTRAQEKTFAGFVRLATIAIAVSVGLLIFLALANA